MSDPAGSHTVWLRTTSRDHTRRLYEIVQDGMRTIGAQPAEMRGSTIAKGLHQIELYSTNGKALKRVMARMEAMGLIKIRQIDVTHF